MASYPRKLGRYNSSELYGITHGYLTPAQWISGREKTIADMLKMWNGNLVHDHVQRLLPASGNEVKREHLYGEITLVGKADHIPPNISNEVWELKSAEEAMDASKPWHDYQVRLYCSIFQREFGKVFQPVQSNDHGLFLKHLGTVGRDDAWFDQELQKLLAFHEQVKEAYGSNGGN